MPLHRRLPKVGFTSRKRLLGKNVFNLVSLRTLGDSDLEGVITVDVLRESGLIRSKARKVKVLGGAEFNKKINLEVHAISASARASVEAAGGSVTLV